MSVYKYSYFQLTFGQEETFHFPEKSYARLKRFNYDAIEITPPKGRYGKGVSMEKYLETHKMLKNDFEMEISCVNECWGEEWDPYSPIYKTLTEPKSAEFAIQETKTTVDFAAELGAPFVTIAVAIHDTITKDNLEDCLHETINTLQTMCDYAKSKGVRLVFEATNHLEMGKFVNTAINHNRIIDAVDRDNIGIQLDWFHANFEELNPYEAVLDAGLRLWHLHFRDSNSLVPGYGSVDFKAVFRALIRIGYKGYCTIETAPIFPDIDTACKDGINYLKTMEHIARLQLSPEYPNGYSLALKTTK